MALTHSVSIWGLLSARHQRKQCRAKRCSAALSLWSVSVQAGEENVNHVRLLGKKEKLPDETGQRNKLRLRVARR